MNFHLITARITLDVHRKNFTSFIYATVASSDWVVMRPGKKSETQGQNLLLLLCAPATILGENNGYNAEVPPSKINHCLITRRKTHAGIFSVSELLELSLIISKGNDFSVQIECANAHTRACVCLCGRHWIRTACSEVT